MSDAKQLIINGEAVLGIELGSTRIKAVLIDRSGNVLATGFHDWENTLLDGVWTYGTDEIHEGLSDCYASLKQSVKTTYGITPESYAAIGISGMMHGYMALNMDRERIAVFQTWRNTNTQAAADELTDLFDFNIPLRWSVAHLYQRMLDKEEHLKDLDYVSTLSGYIHLLLTNERVLGIGDASGMFPIDSATCDYDAEMVKLFDEKIAGKGYKFGLRDIFPKVLVAGEAAGTLTDEGALLLDKEGDLKAGIPLCAPEGDAGTGMVATNSVAERTGNVSAGTSTFAMLTMERGKRLSKLYREIDMVTTPSGFPVAMSHANNGTSDLNAWVNLFKEFTALMGQEADTGLLFEKLYTNALKGDADCGGLMSYGYYSGENITMINEGRLVFLRTPDSNFNLANFMLSHLYTSLGAVKLGMDILVKDEGVKVDRLMGHGGFFKTKEVGQRVLSASVDAPVTVMDTASEGGAWGVALLAAFLLRDDKGVTLEQWLGDEIFAGLTGTTIQATPEEVKGFETFTERYRKALTVEKAAIEAMDW